MHRAQEYFLSPVDESIEKMCFHNSYPHVVAHHISQRYPANMLKDFKKGGLSLVNDYDKFAKIYKIYLYKFNPNGKSWYGNKYSFQLEEDNDNIYVYEEILDKLAQLLFKDVLKYRVYKGTKLDSISEVKDVD